MPFAPAHPAPLLHSFIAFIPLFLLSFYVLAFHVCTVCKADRLQLPVGYRFSLSTADYYIVSAQGATGELCIPLLSSDKFNNKTGTLGGFFFGIWAAPTKYPPSYEMRFCVCRVQYEGDTLNYTTTNIRGTADSGSHDQFISIMRPSSAMAIWNAHASRSLRSLNASLVVDQDMALELKDFDGTLLWKVTNVSSMELLESGNLVIYNPANATVWESFRHITDTLVINQSLQVGSRLVSNDSRYCMAMWPGGLVFSLLTEAGSLPYWIIPALGSSPDVSKPPCSVTNDAYAILSNNLFGQRFRLYSGSCRPGLYLDFAPLDYLDYKIEIVQLRTDGRLHAYSQYGSNVQDVYTLDNAPVYDPSTKDIASSPSETWGMCDVPLACGPSSICSTEEDSCSCPSSSTSKYFIPIVDNDLSKGCQPSVELPKCASQSAEQSAVPDGQSFLEIANTTTISVFAGQMFNYTTSTLDECKNWCNVNCLCDGIVYMINSSRCFPLYNKSSLLNVSSTPANETAQNYVAYLKYISPPSKRRFAITVATTVSVLSFVIILGLAWFGMARRRRSRLSRDAADIELLHILSSLPTRFSYRDLHKATKGFNRPLGRGGFGTVYAGVLLNGRKIAVKKLEMIAFDGEMLKQFLAEVATIGQTSHVNIVNLVGFCWESSNRSLVYEYMENGSLDRWLFSDPKDGQMLDWRTRFSVAIGVSRGLAYLHENSAQPILHLDIKPQNILLDKDFTPKLSDFGLSKLISRDISEVKTVVRGTPGYMAPELGLGEALSKKCDVYSLGMVLLEIVSGRKNVDMSLVNAEAEKWHYPSWAAMKCEEGKVDDLVDRRLKGEFEREEVVRIIEVAMWCIQENPSMRPGAERISSWLGDSATPLEQPPYSTIAYTQARASVTISHSFVSASFQQSAR